MILSNRPSQINVFNYWLTGHPPPASPLSDHDICHAVAGGAIVLVGGLNMQFLSQELLKCLSRQFTKLYTKKVIYTLLDCAQAFRTTRKVFLKTIEGLEGQTNLAYIGELFLAGSKFQRQVH